MANVKWDVKEIMSQHNIYVDALLKASALEHVLANSHSSRANVPLLAVIITVTFPKLWYLKSLSWDRAVF